MPARLAITATGSEIADLFGLSAAGVLRARYNVAPSQTIPVVRVANGSRELAHPRWGLIPHWNTDPEHEGHTNARFETVAEKPSFRDALRSRRCLVPASGFYGWKPVGTRKQPYFFRPADGGPFACAAIWDCWDGPGGPVETVAVLTMPANELVMPMDPRMPVVVGCDQFAAWLDPSEKNPARFLARLEPHPAERMECWPVSTRVNSPTVDDPELIARVRVLPTHTRKSP
jgi:putative SOS response-associated peptidase YedK